MILDYPGKRTDPDPLIKRNRIRTEGINADPKQDRPYILEPSIIKLSGFADPELTHLPTYPLIL